MSCKYTGKHSFTRIIETKLIKDGWKTKREKTWHWKCDWCAERVDNKTSV